MKLEEYVEDFKGVAIGFVIILMESIRNNQKSLIRYKLVFYHLICIKKYLFLSFLSIS